MPKLTPAQAAELAAQRGCPPACRCYNCISDDLSVTATAAGLNVLELDHWERLCRQAASGTARLPASAGRGRRPAVPPPTDPQLAEIARLFADREMSAELAQGLAESTYDRKFGVRQASTLIDVLRSLPSRSAQRPKPAGAATAAEFEDEQLYRHPTRLDRRGNPEIYLVLRSNSSGHFYAQRVRADGQTEYRPGAIRELDPGQALTLQEAQAWGRLTGTCCRCRRRLTHPASIDAGIGPVCVSRF